MRTTYKFAFLLCLFVLPLIGGCQKNRASNELKNYLSTASPETSAMTRHICQDNRTAIDYLFSVEGEKEIIKALSELKVYPIADWAPGNVTEPITALSIGSKGGELSLLFFPDVLIIDGGSAFEYSFDIQKLLKKYEWEHSFSSEGKFFPNQYYCALGSAGWNTAYLNPAEEPSSGEGILKLGNIELIDGKINGNLELIAQGEWFYGRYYYLQGQIDGCWYSIPSKQNMTFEDIGLILSSHNPTALSYPLDAWGTLPSGKYRILIPGNYLPSYEESIPCDAVFEFEIIN